jgi:hypothetical protein
LCFWLCGRDVERAEVRVVSKSEAERCVGVALLPKVRECQSML